MAAGSPTLGVNLAYNPFAPEVPRARRDLDEDLMRMNTGFSPDGLSYSVAGDYGKLAGEIWADYEAASRNPRGLFESPEEYKARVAAAPQRLQQEIAALRSMFGANDKFQPQTPRLFEIGNDIVQVDQNSGTVRKIFDSPETPRPAARYKGPIDAGLPGFQPNTATLTAQEWAEMAPKLPPQVTTNAPVSEYIKWGQKSNAAPSMRLSFPNSTLPTFNSPEDVRTAFRSGKLTRDNAKQILAEQFNMQ